ncbi:hypothetical protein [Chamaesiphon sp. VAR_48_metabat_403]|uniref:hypothetical protein n=1 Tax=Chamaesiphon sp. VAR_48_metabat_403 TaxID=2964700 RepID=UPI00286E4C7E|nr:hypothetical protein [Chamaesiphon sp. VAR_48_metabat_403]
MPIPESIYEKIDNISEFSRSDTDEISPVVDEVISHIQSLLLAPEYSSSSSERAELLYLLGYTYYQYPYRNGNRNIYVNIEKSLLSAIEIKADYSIAWLYSGHNAYDMGRYSDAKERFLKCQENHFNSFYQLILLEMKLCCFIKIEGLAPMLNEIEKFVEQLENHDTPQDIFPYVLISIIKNDNINLESLDKKNKATILLSRLQEC